MKYMVTHSCGHEEEDTSTEEIAEELLSTYKEEYRFKAEQILDDADIDAE